VGLTAIIGVAAFILAMLIWPDWTLRFTRVLAWPVVVLIAFVTFRRPVADLVRGRGLKGAKAGPFEVELEQRQEEADAELPDAGLDEHRVIALLGVLNQIYQSQIDFLQHLFQAKDGLTSSAARAWFAGAFERLGLPQEDPDPLLTWLADKGLVELREDDRYVLGPLGPELLGVIDGFWYAPKRF
jgi:hypothetical protein